ITLLVGPKHKSFVVHKDLICTIIFFNSGFNSQFKERVEGEMHMPEDHPGTISLFVDWLYGEKVLEGNSQSHLDSLYHLYFFATKINKSDLMDASIDRIQHISNDVNRYIRPEMLKLVYENIPENSRLRVFNSRLYRYGLYQRHQKK
ncbi:hypothetical protein B0J14DRAFT_449261, partial [Halenospora varia]